MIRIITDSSSEINVEMAKELNIEVVPIRVVFNDGEYVPFKEISNEEFYKKMAESPVLPKTTQTPPHEFEEIFNDAIQKNDEVIAILISSKISGTYNSAIIAKNSCNNQNIHVIDSKNATFALGILVVEAVKMRDNGAGVDEICETIDQYKEKLEMYAIIDDLKYLQKGGRISSTQSIVGSMLSIKPIIAIKDGMVVSFAKERGMRKAFEWFVKQVAIDGIDFSKAAAVASSNDKDAIINLLDFFKERNVDANKFTKFEIGPTIGVHGGPGAVAISFFRK